MENNTVIICRWCFSNLSHVVHKNFITKIYKLIGKGKTMNKIIIKLLSPITAKLITVAVCGFLVFNTVLPISNLAIRSFFVSVDILQRNPMLYEVITATKLNEIILESFLCDFGDNNKGCIPVKNADNNKDSSSVPGSSSMAMVSNAMNLVLMGFSQDVNNKAKMDNIVSHRGALYSVDNAFIGQKIEAREWLRNAEGAVSAIRKTLIAIDLPRAGIEDSIFIGIAVMRPLLK
jgi:hypothetical protein